MENINEFEEVIPTRFLSNQARDEFLALLESDHEPNDALKAAAAEYNKGWYVGDEYHFQLPAPGTEADGELNESRPLCGC